KDEQVAEVKGHHASLQISQGHLLAPTSLMKSECDSRISLTMASHSFLAMGARSDRERSNRSDIHLNTSSAVMPAPRSLATSPHTVARSAPRNTRTPASGETHRAAFLACPDRLAPSHAGTRSCGSPSAP